MSSSLHVVAGYPTLYISPRRPVCVDSFCPPLPSVHSCSPSISATPTIFVWAHTYKDSLVRTFLSAWHCHPVILLALVPPVRMCGYLSLRYVFVSSAKSLLALFLRDPLGASASRPSPVRHSGYLCALYGPLTQHSFSSHLSRPLPLSACTSLEVPQGSVAGVARSAPCRSVLPRRLPCYACLDRLCDFVFVVLPLPISLY